MDISHVILMFVVMLLLAVFTQPLALLLRIPFSALLVIVGFISATVITGLGFDTGLRWYHIEPLLLNVLLPVLIFETALNINFQQLLRNLPQVLMLAIPAMLLSTLIIAVILYFALESPVGLPWIAALLCGALLSATDPVAVLDMFKRFDVSGQISVIMEGESLFNDAVAIVLFSMLLVFATTSGTALTWSGPVVEFLYVFVGGILAGSLLGIGASVAYRLIKDTLVRAAISLSFAYLTFIFAEHWLHMSGVVAVLACGLVLGRTAHRDKLESGDFILSAWAFFAFVANAVVFLLLGVTVTLQMFSDMWLGMLFGILAVIVARAVAVYGTLPLLNVFPVAHKTSLKQQTVIYWGGLRGAIAVALALSLPLELEYWYPIQSITYGVVMFSLFLQAPSMSLLLKRFKGI